MEDILATLSRVCEPQLGNVRIDSGSGAVKSYAGLSDSLPSHENGLLSGPVLKCECPWNKSFTCVQPDYEQWTGPQYGGVFHMASVQVMIHSSFLHGQRSTIANTQIVANEWPALTDGFRYTEATYLAVLQNGAPAHKPDLADYDLIIGSPQFDICGKFNRGEIDELWMYGAPYFGFYESRLVGPGAYHLTTAYDRTHNCNKLRHHGFEL
jgi:hypothetical protein